MDPPNNYWIIFIYFFICKIIDKTFFYSNYLLYVCFKLLIKKYKVMREYKGLTKERVLKVCEGTSGFLKIKIINSKDTFDYIKKFYNDDIEIFESFFILLLNKSNNTIGYAKISQGGVAGTVVDIKIIAKYCIDCLASSVILAHNHPSGELTPSQADITITEKTKKALNLLDVNVIDHIILTKNGYYSLADNGEI